MGPLEVRMLNDLCTGDLAAGMALMDRLLEAADPRVVALSQAIGELVQHVGQFWHGVNPNPAGLTDLELTEQLDALRWSSATDTATALADLQDKLQVLFWREWHTMPALTELQRLIERSLELVGTSGG